MKYTVSINEKNRIVTVNLDGYIGEAKCCPTDNFNLSTGIELALARAKVAKKNAKVAPTKPMGVMELVKALEKALPKGQMVVVGNGDELTDTQKKWLADLAGVKPCECKCHDEEVFEKWELDEAYDRGCKDGYDDGYSDGYESGRSETKSLLVGMLEEVISDLE